MPLWIAIPGFFICACLGYALCCVCFVSSQADRAMEGAIHAIHQSKEGEGMRVLIKRCKECGKRVDGNWMDDVAKKLEGNQLCFSCNFWAEKVGIRDKLRVARIEGRHYQIGAENSGGSFRGFGGRGFVILFNDGRRVETTNLWHQGTIPVHFKERLPDNAKFDRDIERKTSPRGYESLGG